MNSFIKYYIINFNSFVPVNLAQLVGTLHNLCRGQGSNPGHPTSPHLIVQSPITRLLDPKKYCIELELTSYKYQMPL